MFPQPTPSIHSIALAILFNNPNYASRIPLWVLPFLTLLAAVLLVPTIFTRMCAKAEDLKPLKIVEKQVLAVAEILQEKQETKFAYYNPRLDPRNYLHGPLSINPATRLRQMLARPGIIVSDHISLSRH